MINSRYNKHLNQLADYAKRSIKSLRRAISIEIQPKNEALIQTEIEVLELLKELTEILELHLESSYVPALQGLIERNESDGKKRAQRRLEVRIRMIVKTVSELAELFGALYGENRGEQWNSFFINRICQHINPKARVIIRPFWEYNYTFFPISLILERIARFVRWTDVALSKQLHKTLDDAPYFFILTLPTTAVENVLHMAIWAHEVGHFFDSIYLSGGTTSDLRSLNGPGTISSSLLADLKLKLNKKYSESQLAVDQTNRLVRMLAGWSSEIFADLFSIKLIGPAALFAFYEFVNPVISDFELSDTHPPFHIRLKLMCDELENWCSHFPNWDESLPDHVKSEYRKEIAYLKAVTEESHDNLFHTTSSIGHEFAEALSESIEEIASLISKTLDSISLNLSKIFLQPEDLATASSAISNLENRIPLTLDIGYYTSESKEDKVESLRYLARVYNFGWLYWLAHSYNGSIHDADSSLDEHETLNVLLQKSLENIGFSIWYYQSAGLNPVDLRVPAVSEDMPVVDGSGGVLSRASILKLINSGELIIRPLIDEKQIGNVSVDIRLGTALSYQTSGELVQSLSSTMDSLNTVSQEDVREAIQIRVGQGYVLHPGQTVNVRTLEFFAIPYNIMGICMVKTSASRIGLTINMSGPLEPGFKGVVSLTLTNGASVPIKLYPGVRVAEIVFNRVI